MRVDELKNKILQLAIQGKLVPQDEKDIPASVLLEEIKKEKEQLIKEKKIKREKLLPEITEEEKLFEIPKGWEWVRLADITHSLLLNDGDWILSENMCEADEVKLIQLGSIGFGEFIYKGYKNISEQTFIDLKCKEIDKGDILINRLLGKKLYACILPEIEGKKITSVDTCFIKPNKKIYNSKYLMYVFLSDYFQKVVFGKIGGTTRQRISKGNLITIAFPFPSVAEQQRIVQKVDELFEIIDELSKNKEAMLKNISDTRNKVLQLAIQGKLVEQKPEDTPASILLEEIRKEKEKLIKEKKIKKEKPLPEITEEDKLFEIPKGWEWVRLGNIANIIMGQSPDSSYVSEDKNGIEFHQGKTAFGKKILDKSGLFCEKPTKVAEAGDILLSVRAPVGAVNFTDREVCIGRGLTAIRAINNKDNRFIFYIIKALEKELIGKATGTTFLAISSKEIKELVMPLPSVEEQLRIVKKVDEIMAYLDELEKTILNDSII